MDVLIEFEQVRTEWIRFWWIGPREPYTWTVRIERIKTTVDSMDELEQVVADHIKKMTTGLKQDLVRTRITIWPQAAAT